MQIRRHYINGNANDHRNYEYISRSTPELITIIIVAFAASLTGMWLCCCCKKSKPKSQSHHQGVDNLSHQHQDLRHHDQPSRRKHQQYRSRKHPPKQQPHGGHERPVVPASDANLGKREPRKVKLMSQVQQPLEESILSVAQQKLPSKMGQQVISLPSTDLVVPRRPYPKKLAAQRSPTTESRSPSPPAPTSFDTAESVIPPPPKRQAAKIAREAPPAPREGVEAAPTTEQSQAFKIYTETAIKKIQKPPPPIRNTQRVEQKKQDVVEVKIEETEKPATNTTQRRKDSEKKVTVEQPKLAEGSTIKAPSSNKSSQRSKKKSALFKVYSETFMNKAAEHAPKMFPKSEPKAASSKIISIPSPSTPRPNPVTAQKSVARTEPVPAHLKDYQTFFVVKENAMKASVRRSVRKSRKIEESDKKEKGGGRN